jgi:hypothetical protein
MKLVLKVLELRKFQMQSRVKISGLHAAHCVVQVSVASESFHAYECLKTSRTDEKGPPL